MVSAAQTGSPKDGDNSGGPENIGSENIGSENTGSGGDGHLDAHPLIELFGGIRPMASKLGVPVSTVQGWRERNAIPTLRLAAIKDAAAKHDITILPEHVVLQMGPASPPEPSNHEDAVVRGESRTERMSSASVTQKPAVGDNGKLVPVLAGAAVVIAVIALLVGLFDGSGTPVDSTGVAVDRQLTADVEALTTQVESVAARVSVLETLAEGSVEVGDQVAALAARVEAGVDDDVGAQVAGLQARLDGLADGAGEEPSDLLVQVDDLTVALAEMQTVIEGLAAAPAGPPADVATLTTRVEAVEAGLVGAVAAVGSQDPALDNTVVAGLGERLEELEALVDAAGSPVAQSFARDSAMGFATLRLQQQLATGGPPAAVLARARTAAQDDDEMTGLVAAVADAVGSDDVMTVAALVRGFNDMAPGLARDLSRGTAAVAEDADWLARAQARLAQVVTVERPGADAPADVGREGVVAEAQALLAGGDLTGAAAAIAGVADGNAVATAWVAGVQQQVAVAAAMDELETAVFDRLVAGRAVGD